MGNSENLLEGEREVELVAFTHPHEVTTLLVHPQKLFPIHPTD